MATPGRFSIPCCAPFLHFWLAYDHPFVDGNGRTARTLFYWSMLRHGYWLVEFLTISQIIRGGLAQYARAFLNTEMDDNDLTYFIRYHLAVLDRALRALHEYIARKSAQQRHLASVVRGLTDLNHRQHALLGHALRHPDYRYTIEAHRMSHGVVYQTARTDLLELVEAGLLDSRKIRIDGPSTPSTIWNDACQGVTGADSVSARRHHHNAPVLLIFNELVMN